VAQNQHTVLRAAAILHTLQVCWTKATNCHNSMRKRSHHIQCSHLLASQESFPMFGHRNVDNRFLSRSDDSYNSDQLINQISFL